MGELQRLLYYHALDVKWVGALPGIVARLVTALADYQEVALAMGLIHIHWLWSILQTLRRSSQGVSWSVLEAYLLGCSKCVHWGQNSLWSWNQRSA